MKPIVLDAMGGDNAPSVVVEGAREALNCGISVELVGDPNRIPDTDGTVSYTHLRAHET